MEYKDRCERAEVELSALLNPDIHPFTLDGIQKVLTILRGETE
jgi:hypothetical protein